MEHLSDFTFVSMVNLTFCRRDSYLAHVKSGLKQDTLTALRQAPLALPTLFPDSVLKRAEDDIVRFEDKNGQSHGQYGGRKENRFHPYKQSDRQTQDQRSDKHSMETTGSFPQQEQERRSTNKFSSRPARGQLT